MHPPTACRHGSGAHKCPSIRQRMARPEDAACCFIGVLGTLSAAQRLNERPVERWTTGRCTWTDRKPVMRLGHACRPERFMEPSFDAAGYVADLRRFVPLETLSTELEGHLTTLKNRVGPLTPNLLTLTVAPLWIPWTSTRAYESRTLSCVPNQTMTRTALFHPYACVAAQCPTLRVAMTPVACYQFENGFVAIVFDSSKHRKVRNITSLVTAAGGGYQRGLRRLREPEHEAGQRRWRGPPHAEAAAGAQGEPAARLARSRKSAARILVAILLSSCQTSHAASTYCRLHHHEQSAVLFRTENTRSRATASEHTTCK